MSKDIETYVLAEMRTVDLLDGGKAEVIRTVLRTFSSMRRAEEDMQLLNETLPDLPFRIFTVGHIDN